MSNDCIGEFVIDHIEIYSPMAKTLAYWHKHALGFHVIALSGAETGHPGMASYVVRSGNIHLVLTSSFPTSQGFGDHSVAGFIGRNYCGVRSVALRVSSVKDVFERAIVAGGIPIRFPTVLEDRYGRFEECSIKLYDENEIVFMCRDDYSGVFKPGYREVAGYEQSAQALLTGIDHIASELRINEVGYWTNYVTRTIGTSLVQNIKRGTDNNTGMIMNISQSPDKNLTLVMAEPESYGGSSKVQRNIDLFGPGIHHLAFSTGDLMSTVQSFKERGVEFVDIPSSYYTLLRTSEDMQGIDVDRLEELGVLVDKENGRYLLQKFIKPISDRPFFLYELVQRMSGYEGFALRNINILKRAEEMEIMKVQ